MSWRDSLSSKTTRGLWFLHNRLFDNLRRNLTYEFLWRNAAEDSARFVEANFDDAVLYQHRSDFWAFILRSLPAEGELLEIGVFEGASINLIADSLKKRHDARLVNGFDAFEGLEEQWSGEGLAEGHFDRGGVLPSVRSNVRLHKGWVQDTLQPFLIAQNNPNLALVHIDTDTYTPARYILETIKPLLNSGTIIVFDELIGYPNWREHEFKALNEVLDRSTYRYIGFTSRQAAIRIL